MNFWRFFLNRVFIFFILIATTGGAFAQRANRLKIADLFKNSGKYEQALELYLQAYHSGQSSPILINNIQDCYESLKRYDDLIAFLQELIGKYPDNVDYRVKLGRAYYLAGERQKAFGLWDQILKAYPKNVYMYRSLGANLIQLRLYNRAIEVYRLAIQNIPRQNSLYREIALIYRAQLNYGKALENYLNYYRFFPNQFAYIRSQIIAMTRDTSAIPQMIVALQSYRKKHRQLLGLDELLADMYVRQKDFDRAFQVYFDLYHRTGDGSYLFRFVNKAADNEAYAYAVKGLQILVKKEKIKSRRRQYQLELARNYYRWAGQTFKANQAKRARKLLDKADAAADAIIKEKPTSPYRWAAYDLKGDIALKFFENTDRAISWYQKALHSHIDVRYKDRIRLKLARCFVIKGQLNDADRILAKVHSSTYRHLAQYRQAEILFYRGHLNRAQKAFYALDKMLPLQDSLKNNVLERLMLLEQSRQDSAALVKYARAELLIRQKKLSEAAEMFAALAQSPLAIGMQSGEKAVTLFIKLGKYDRALALIKKLRAAHPNDAGDDRLYFLLGLVQEKARHWKEAFTTYQTLITKFPDSFYLEQAREKARWIKENILKEQVE